MRDLDDIYFYVGMDNEAAAERLERSFLRKVATLAAHPRMGVRHPEIFPAARMLIEGWYLILYQTYPADDDAPVEHIDIVRVVHGRRDLRSLPWIIQ